MRFLRPDQLEREQRKPSSQGSPSRGGSRETRKYGHPRFPRAWRFVKAKAGTVGVGRGVAGGRWRGVAHTKWPPYRGLLKKSVRKRLLEKVVGSLGKETWCWDQTLKQGDGDTRGKGMGVI